MKTLEEIEKMTPIECFRELCPYVDLTKEGLALYEKIIEELKRAEHLEKRRENQNCYEKEN